MTENPNPLPDPDTAARLLEQGLAGESSGRGKRRPPPPPEVIQPHFPDLEIEAVVGEGGMGVVYRARHPRLDRLVALKILPEALSDDPTFAERFGREARTLARLEHPHIVRVYDFGENDGLYYLLMEYVDGASLRDVLREGRMRPEEALALVPQICEALQFAHDAGVVHRDVKPENILVDTSGHAKITDFGLAKLVRQHPGDVTLTGTGQVMGTAQYMAPEQYRSPQDVDHRADIFSLGVVFYEMLTGDLPVGRFRPPSHEGDVDRRIDEIVLKALERERELRYQHAHDVLDDVHGLHRAHPSAARSTPPSSKRNGALRLWLAGLAIPLGFAAFAVVHEAWGAIVRGSEDAFQRELFKGLAAAAVFLAGGVLAAQVAFLARRRGEDGRDRFRGALALAAIDFLLVPAILIAAAFEIQTHAISDAPPRLSIVVGPPPPPKEDVTRVEAGAVVNRLCARWTVHPEGLAFEDAMRLYDTDSEAEIRRLSAEERRSAIEEGRLGLPLLDPEKLRGPLGDFHVDAVEADPAAPRTGATVTLRRRAEGRVTVVRFPIRYGETRTTTTAGDVWTGFSGWFFAAGPVTIDHRPDEGEE